MDFYDLAEVWLKCQEKFKESFSGSVYNTWFRPINPLELTSEYCRVEVKTEFFKKLLEEQYVPIIKSILAGIVGKNIDLIIEVAKAEESADNTSNANSDLYTPPTKPSQSPVAQNLFPEKNVVDTSNLNPKYLFENFVIGNSNRFAHAAASKVSENPGVAYNPLFIYGGSGLGKTHLMHAIGNKLKQNNPSLQVLYISSESFTNEIVEAIFKKTTESFRQKYRNIDCLIIDDIQFLEGKEQTQEEFFHTFNALYDANKQIIISSDRPPQVIEYLEDRLKTRFEWGLKADIQPPDLETRMAIIRQKAAADNIELPNEVITLLATSITNNVREIEGAYNGVIARTSMLNLPLTLDSVKQILTEIGINTNKAKSITIEDISQTVAKYFGINVMDLSNKKRTQSLVYPRQIAMYLCRELADLTYPKIGEYYGGRDHTTVIHAYEKISRSKKTDKKLSRNLEEISNLLKQ